MALGDVAPDAIVDALWQASAAHCAALHGPAWVHAGAAFVAATPDDTGEDDDEPRDVFVLVLAAP